MGHFHQNFINKKNIPSQGCVWSTPGWYKMTISPGPKITSFIIYCFLEMATYTSWCSIYFNQNTCIWNIFPSLKICVYLILQTTVMRSKGDYYLRFINEKLKLRRAVDLPKVTWKAEVELRKLTIILVPPLLNAFIKLGLSASCLWHTEMQDIKVHKKGCHDPMVASHNCHLLIKHHLLETKISLVFCLGLHLTPTDILFLLIYFPFIPLFFTIKLFCIIFFKKSL